MRNTRRAPTTTSLSTQPWAPGGRRPAPPEALALLARLTDRDRSLLELLAEHDVLTTDQIAALLFPNLDRAQRRLVTLFRWHVLDRFRRPVLDGHMTSWRYTLGPGGAALHAAMRGAVPPRPRDVRERSLRLAAHPHLDHRLGVNGFFTALAQHARHHGDIQLVRWYGERTATDACGALARPDGLGHWRQGNLNVLFCLEYDTGRETLGTVTAKLEGYADLAHAGGPQLSTPDYQIPSHATFWVLFHLHSAVREANLRRHLADTVSVPGSAAAPANWAIATTSAEVAPSQNPGGDIWLPLGAHHRCPLGDLAHQ